jgi:hypothetical protein
LQNSSPYEVCWLNPDYVAEVGVYAQEAADTQHIGKTKFKNLKKEKNGY